MTKNNKNGEKSTFQQVHDMLYGNQKEINEIVLEENEVKHEEVISGQSQSKVERFGTPLFAHQ